MSDSGSTEHGDSPGGAEATTGSGAEGGRSRRRHRLRGAVAALLVIFAVLFAILASVAMWSHELLLNTDTFVKTVAPVMKDPQVTRAAGDIVADATVKMTGLDRRPDSAGAGAAVEAPDVDEVRGEVAASTTDLLRTDKAYSAWEKTLRYTHRQLVSLLRNRDDLLEFRGDDVQIDLVPFVAAGVRQVEKILPGAIKGSGALPRLDSDASPDRQRAELATYLGRTPTDDFGRVTLFERSDIEPAQSAVRLFDVLVWALVGVTAALAIVAVVVSPRRLRTLVYLGIGVVVVVLVSVLVIGEVRNTLVAHATGQSGPIVVGAADRIFDSLRNAVIWLLVAGLVVTAGAYVATRPRWTRRGRGRNALLDLLRTYSDPLRMVVGAATVVVVLFVPISLGGGLALVAVAATVIVALTWLDRAHEEAGREAGA